MMAKSSPLTRCVTITALAYVWAPTNGTAATIASPPPDVPQIVAGVQRHDQFKQAHLQDFCVTRKYTFKSSRASSPAEFTVRLWFQRGVGKSYEITSATNASVLSRKVLDRILASELEASRPNAHEQSHLTFENYDFALLGTEMLAGRRCYVLQLSPRKKSRYLIQGKAWIDAEQFALRKVEGHPSASLSFWVGKPYLTQEFQKYGDFWMASHNRTLSESYLWGRSELTIEYTQYEMNTGATGSLAMQHKRSPRPLD